MTGGAVPAWARWGIVLALAVVFIALSLSTSEGAGSGFSDLPNADKLAHAGFFVVFALAGALAFDGRLFTPRGAAVLAVLLACALGCMGETAQSFTSYRSAEFPDLLADLVGAGWGAVLYGAKTAFARTRD